MSLSLSLSVRALRAQNRVSESGELRELSELEDQVSLDPAERRLPLQRSPHPALWLFCTLLYGVPLSGLALLLNWGLG